MCVERPESAVCVCSLLRVCGSAGACLRVWGCSIIHSSGSLRQLRAERGEMWHRKSYLAVLFLPFVGRCFHLRVRYVAN